MSAAEMKQTVALNTEVVFKWGGYHNVYKLPDKQAFDACDFSKATKLASYDEGPYTYKASSAGIVYFACEVGGHCSFRQKLALTVTARPTWANVGSNIQCDAGAGEVYRSQSPGKVPDLAACQKSCENDAGCKSITFFNSGWCSHFSTGCTKTKSASKAISMRLSGAQQTTAAPISAGARRTWANVGSNIQCDAGAGEVYRSQSPGKVPDLAACQKSCENDAGCKSITLFNSGWCSHFSTGCTETKSANKAISMRLTS